LPEEPNDMLPVGNVIPGPVSRLHLKGLQSRNITFRQSEFARF
jgi:hypothetical protein